MKQAREDIDAEIAGLKPWKMSSGSARECQTISAALIIDPERVNFMIK